MILFACLHRLVRGVLGALVVLPTRELALQIYNVFAALCPPVGLWVGLAAAQLPLPAEAAALNEGQVNILIATARSSHVASEGSKAYDRTHKLGISGELLMAQKTMFGVAVGDAVHKSSVCLRIALGI